MLNWICYTIGKEREHERENEMKYVKTKNAFKAKELRYVNYSTFKNIFIYPTDEKVKFVDDKTGKTYTRKVWTDHFRKYVSDKGGKFIGLLEHSDGTYHVHEQFEEVVRYDLV